MFDLLNTKSESFKSFIKAYFFGCLILIPFEKCGGWGEGSKITLKGQINITRPNYEGVRDKNTIKFLLFYIAFFQKQKK